MGAHSFDGVGMLVRQQSRGAFLWGDGTDFVCGIFSVVDSFDCFFVSPVATQIPVSYAQRNVGRISDAGVDSFCYALRRVDLYDGIYGEGSSGFSA